MMPMNVFGYEVCKRCTAPVALDIWQATGGVCLHCRVPAAPLRVRVDTGVVEVLPRTRRQRKGRKSAKQKRHERTVDKVKMRALRRLRDLHLGDYLAILAQEREAAGLDPMPASVRVNLPIPDPAVYHPATEGDACGRSEDVPASS